MTSSTTWQAAKLDKGMRLLSLSSFLALVNALSITIPARGTLCFKELASQGQNLGLMFHVVRGGFLDIDLTVIS